MIIHSNFHSHEDAPLSWASPHPQTCAPCCPISGPANNWTIPVKLQANHGFRTLLAPPITPSLDPCFLLPFISPTWHQASPLQSVFSFSSYTLSLAPPQPDVPSLLSLKGTPLNVYRSWSSRSSSAFFRPGWAGNIGSDGSSDGEGLLRRGTSGETPVLLQGWCVLWWATMLFLEENILGQKVRKLYLT